MFRLEEKEKRRREFSDSTFVGNNFNVTEIVSGCVVAVGQNFVERYDFHKKKCLIVFFPYMPEYIFTVF